MKLYVTRDECNDFYIFTEYPDPVKSEDPYIKWDHPTSQEVCQSGSVGKLLDKLLSPLTFEAGQLAEIEVREVARWELPE